RRGRVRHPGGQHLRLEHRGGDRHTLQLLDRRKQRLPAGRRVVAHAVPRGQELAERLRRYRLDLATERGQRAALDPTENLGACPLCSVTARVERTAEYRAGGGEPLQRRL